MVNLWLPPLPLTTVRSNACHATCVRDTSPHWTGCAARHETGLQCSELATPRGYTTAIPQRSVYWKRKQTLNKKRRVQHWPSRHLQQTFRTHETTFPQVPNFGPRHLGREEESRHTQGRVGRSQKRAAKHAVCNTCQNAFTFNRPSSGNVKAMKQAWTKNMMRMIHLRKAHS